MHYKAGADLETLSAGGRWADANFLFFSKNMPKNLSFYASVWGRSPQSPTPVSATAIRCSQQGVPGSLASLKVDRTCLCLSRMSANRDTPLTSKAPSTATRSSVLQSTRAPTMTISRARRQAMARCATSVPASATDALHADVCFCNSLLFVVFLLFAKHCIVIVQY